MNGANSSHPSRPARRRVLYGRRKGRPLRPGRRRLLAELLPRVGVPVAGRLAGPPPVPEDRPLDPRAFFEGPPPFEGESPPPREVWLEVGFGAGEHLAAQAEAHPEIGFIGCEPFVNGVAALLARIQARRLPNIRVFGDDARLVIERLAPAALGRVFVLFPDPWPKTRHARRRFIAPDTLDDLARVMADGAELRVATDDPVQLRWALTALIGHPDFDWCAERAEDWSRRPADQPPTRYEEKALAKGAHPVYLVFRRRVRTARDRQNT